MTYEERRCWANCSCN